MKIAIITGASSGLGQELVYQAAKAYHWLDEIWVIARRKERLEALKKVVPVKVRVLPLDLTSEIDVKNLKALLDDQKPRIKLLANASGYGKIGSFADIGYEDNLGMIELNCKALTAVTYLCLPYLYSGSRVVQFASAAAFMPQPGFSVYAATKAYVLSFSRGLRYELKDRGITVTAVCPGPVNTEFFDDARVGEKALNLKTYAVPARRVVYQALKDAAVGKELSVYTATMKAARAASKMIPHSCILKGLTVFSK